MRKTAVPGVYGNINLIMLPCHCTDGNIILIMLPSAAGPPSSAWKAWRLSPAAAALPRASPPENAPGTRYGSAKRSPAATSWWVNEARPAQGAAKALRNTWCAPSHKLQGPDSAGTGPDCNRMRLLGRRYCSLRRHDPGRCHRITRALTCVRVEKTVCLRAFRGSRAHKRAAFERIQRACVLLHRKV